MDQGRNIVVNVRKMENGERQVEKYICGRVNV